MSLGGDWPNPIAQYNNRATSLKRITSYNAQRHQTDASPCKGALGIDLCHYGQKVQIIALSQDLVNKNGTGLFKYGEWVQTTHPNPACNLSGVVLDVMNPRFVRSVDYFRLDRSQNHGLCTGGIIESIAGQNFFDMFPEQGEHFPEY